MYRLSYERRGDISFIARGTKYDIVTRAIKLILPNLECDNLFITYLCLYLGQKSDIFSHYLYFEYIPEWMQNYCLKYAKQVEITNKPKITYLLIAANFFLLFSLYYCIFCCCLSIDPSALTFRRTPSLF